MAEQLDSSFRWNDKVEAGIKKGSSVEYFDEKITLPNWMCSQPHAQYIFMMSIILLFPETR